MGRVKTLIDKKLRAKIAHLSNNSHNSEKKFQVDLVSKDFHFFRHIL